MSVRCLKMKRDAGVKCCLFNSKKTAFHSSVSLHFQATNGCYGFSNLKVAGLSLTLEQQKKHRFFGWYKCLPVINFKVMMLLQLSVCIRFWSFKKQRGLLPSVNSYVCEVSVVNIEKCAKVNSCSILSWLMQDIPVCVTRTNDKEVGDWHDFCYTVGVCQSSRVSYAWKTEWKVLAYYFYFFPLPDVWLYGQHLTNLSINIALHSGLKIFAVS